MDRIRIIGGERLQGTIPISGAKNASLPLMIASLLTRETLAEAISVKSCCHHLRLQRGGPSGPRRQPGTPELDQHPLDTVAA